MQLATQTSVQSLPPGAAIEPDVAQRDSRYAQYKVIRRNGAVVGFEPSKITVAMTKAFIAVNGGTGAASARVRELVAGLTEQAVTALIRRQPAGGTFHIEDIQDQVELALMRSGEHDVARAYVLYREERARARAKQKEAQPEAAPQSLNVTENGTLASARSGSAARSDQGIVRRTRPRGRPRGDSAERAQGSVRRRADGRGAQGRHPGGARADREGSGLQLRHRPAVAQQHPLRNPGSGSDPGGNALPVRRLFPALHREGHRGRPARSAGWQRSISSRWARRWMPTGI